MKKLVIAAVLVLSGCCAAQPPNVRVELMSLFLLDEVTITPTGMQATWRKCGSCAAQPLHNSLVARAKANAVATDSVTSPVIIFAGGIRVASAQSSRGIAQTLEIRAQGGHLQLIAVMPVEDYVAEVVQGETSGSMPTEALRAMAVAARTYTARFRERHKHEGFDFCDSTHCQFIRPSVTEAVRQAVASTRGEVLWAGGEPIYAYYHRDCGGHTESAATVWPGTPRLRGDAHEDPFCVRVSKPWRADISKGDLEAALTRASLRVPHEWTRVDASKEKSGRVSRLRFASASGESAEVSASSLRFALGRAYGWATLKSDLYEIEVHGDHVIFTGRGTGHGVGLCQIGAAEMARQGKSYREILSFYYPAATVSVAAAGIPWQTSRFASVDVRAVRAMSSEFGTRAEKALAWAEQETGLTAEHRPTIELYPTVQIFRDSTGEPGWVSASTRGDVVRMEPTSLLAEQMESVLRHEFVHLLLEQHAAESVPLWFREGLAMRITGEHVKAKASMNTEDAERALRNRDDREQVQRAYAFALTTVSRLEQRYGRAQLMRRLREGLPRDFDPSAADDRSADGSTSKQPSK